MKMVRRILGPGVVGLCLLALAVGPALAIPVPCCENGSKPNKLCSVDGECPNICIGGIRDGRDCLEFEQCPGVCIGGDRDGVRCLNDGGCPGGGTCTEPGICDFGTCTATCEREKPKETPSDPVSELLQLPTPTDASLELPAPQPCP